MQKEEEKMDVKAWAVTMGLGAAAGAVGILMMSKNNPTRKIATQAADKLENTAWKVSDKMTRKFDL